MKPRTRKFATVYLFAVSLLVSADIVVRAIWDEPVSLLFTGSLLLLLVSWIGLRSGARWAWWVLVGTYVAWLFGAAIRANISVRAAGSESHEDFVWLFYQMILFGLFAVLPLIVLILDKPFVWTEAVYRTKNRRLIAIALLPIVASSCLWLHHNLPSRRAQEDDIREAVLRYQFAHNASGQQQNAGAYYISLRYVDTEESLNAVTEFFISAQFLLIDWYRDPSDDFLKRFEGGGTPVRKVSSCGSGVEGVYEINTKERGLIFEVGNIKWISRQEAEVKGGYYEGGLSSSGNTYRLRQKNGRWTVVSDRMDWISWVSPHLLQCLDIDGHKGIETDIGLGYNPRRGVLI